MTDQAGELFGDYERTGRLDLLDAAIALFRDAVAAASSDRPVCLSNLGVALYVRFERSGQQTDLDEAVTAFRDAVTTTPPDHPDHPGYLYRVALLLGLRFGLTGQQADLDKLITVGREVVTATPPEHPDHPTCQSNLGNALLIRFERSGQQSDLDDAITAGRDAVATAPPDHPDRPRYLFKLALALGARFERSGQQADLDDAVTVGREAVATTPPDHPDRFACLSNLGGALGALFERSGQQADLDDAITLGREAVATTPPDHPDHPTCLSNLGNALLNRFERTGQQADLDDAITLGREAVATTPPDHPYHPLHLATLGLALRTRFERSGQQADLDDAITLGREAVATTPLGHPARGKCLVNLGGALQRRFQRSGQQADLELAITTYRNAVDDTPPNHPERLMYLSNLGGALLTRFEFTSQQADLDDAITTCRNAVDDTPPNHPERPMYQANLALALRDRFKFTSQQTDLDQAISLGRDAVTGIPPDQPNRPIYLSNLALALLTRFGFTSQQADLDQAISLGRDAVDTTPPDHPNRPMYLSNLALAVRDRFERNGQPADLDDAVANCCDAVTATPPDHPNRPLYLSNLGDALRARFGRTGQQADLSQAITAFRDAVGVESGSPVVRMRAGLAWGRAAIDDGRVESAADGFASAVGLLPLLAWHGLPRATREQHLAEWRGLAADAAACAIRAGRPEWAVELLEAGRSVLWSQTLSLRTDLTDLGQQAPELALRLDQIRSQLDAPLPGTSAEAITAGGDDSVEQLRAAQKRAVEDRMRLAREFDDILTQVRKLGGFEHFLAPTPFTQLRVAATGGPVVIVNTSRHGCHALLLTTTGVQVVNLPALTHDQVIGQANTLLGVLNRATQRDLPFRDREKDRHTVFDILGWLWDTVTGSVLTSLGYTSPPSPHEGCPRIWWCPTGPLTLLPLHAAGHHRRHQRPDTPATTDSVADRVISSYTPTLTALLRARTAPGPTGLPRLLAIGMPTTPDAADLPAVPAELDRVHARYPIITRLQSPTHQLDPGPSPDPATQPTTTRVLAELPHHTWVHLSCHGSQHPTNPAESAFWLTDGPLRIIDLIQQHDHGPRELAFLSACQTATGGLRTLDEAIHLAAAMQLLGYRHVIATLWSIYDSPAPDVADTVYATLTATGTPNANHAATALHHAVLALRAKHPTEPLAWAPYLHAGP